MRTEIFCPGGRREDVCTGLGNRFRKVLREEVTFWLHLEHWEGVFHVIVGLRMFRKGRQAEAKGEIGSKLETSDSTTDVIIQMRKYDGRNYSSSGCRIVK